MSESTTRKTIAEWYGAAPSGSTHMVVVCDEFSWEDYPVYVSAEEDARKVAEALGKKSMTKVMEVYRLDYSLDKQLAMKRCHTYDLPLDGHDDQVLQKLAAIETGLLELWVDDGEPVVFALFQAELARRRAYALDAVIREAKATEDAARRAERKARWEESGS